MTILFLLVLGGFSGAAAGGSKLATDAASKTAHRNHTDAATSSTSSVAPASS